MRLQLDRWRKVPLTLLVVDVFAVFGHMHDRSYVAVFFCFVFLAETGGVTPISLMKVNMASQPALKTPLPTYMQARKTAGFKVRTKASSSLHG